MENPNKKFNIHLSNSQINFSEMRDYKQPVIKNK